MGEKADEKIWSPQDLRNASTTWNLAGDKKLLQMLENMHKDFVEKTENTSGKLDTLLVDLEKTSLSLKNVNNRFMGLSDTQFVEHRVQEDEAEIINVPDKDTRNLINLSETSAIKEKEKEEAARREVSLEKVAASLIRLEDLCETFDITPDTDSESDDENSDDAAQLSMLRAKNIYADRPLPYVIGSIEWQNKDHIGLDCDSEDADDGDRKQTEIEEEYSSTDNDDEDESTNNSFDEGRTVQEKKRQMTLPIQNKINIADHNASSVTSTSTNNSTDTTDSEITKINPGPKFSENISSNRNVTHDMLAADSAQEKKQQKLPPVKISNASDFAAELARKLGSTAPPKTGDKENIQSRKENSNTASAKNKHQNFDPGLSKQPDKRVTGNIFLDEPPPMESDMFSDEKDDLFGNYRNHNDEDDEEFISGGLFSDKPKQPAKSSNLFGQKKSSNYDGLFDDPPDDRDNFNNSIIRSNIDKKNPEKSANSGLFDSKSNGLNKKSRGLFDDFDDDDFADFKVNKNDNKSGSKSLFDGSNKPSKSITNVSNNMQQDAIIIKKDVMKEKSLFGDDEDDDASSLFGGQKISEGIAKSDLNNTTKRELRNEKPEISSRSLSAEVADKSSKPPQAKKDSLFGDMDDDDDDDIFASLKKSNISKSKVSTASKQTTSANVGGVLKNASPKPKGLFDNDSDGEDLFSSLKMPAKRGTVIQNPDNKVKNVDESSIKKLSSAASTIGDNPEIVKRPESVADDLKSNQRQDYTADNLDGPTEEKNTPKADSKLEISTTTKFDNYKTADSFVDLESRFPPSDTFEKGKLYGEESHDSCELDGDSKEKIKILPKPKLNPSELSKTSITIERSEPPQKTEKPTISKMKPTIHNAKIIDTADKVIDGNILINNHSNDSRIENQNVKVNEDSAAKINTNNKTNISYYENKNSISEKSSPCSEEALIATKRSNSLFDDFPPPLDATESSTEDIKDVNSLFDDEEDNNDDHLFFKFRAKTAKDEKPSMGLFDDLSPNIDDLANKKPVNIDLFSDEPPELDDSIFNESKDEGASNMFADYPYYKTINVIKSDADTAAEESTLPEKNTIYTSISSKSKLESFPSKPDIVSMKPNFVPAKPIIESKVNPEVAGVKPKIESYKPVSNKENLLIEKTDREIISTTKPKTDTCDKSESVAHFKGLHESKKDNASFEQNNKNETISPTRTVGKLQKSNLNINVKALIPGSAPKLVKEISEKVNAVNRASPIITESELNVDLFNRIEGESEKAVNQINRSSSQNSAEDFSSDQVDRRAPMIESDLMKSVSFDSDSKPGSDVVLSNAASKERVKIQVKRRPSSRRARQEAIRKSAIDVTIPDDVKDKNYNDFTISLPTSPIRDTSISGEQYNHVDNRRDNACLTLTDSNNKEIAISTIDRAYNIDGKEENKLSNKHDLFASLSGTIDSQLFSTVGEKSSIDDLDIFKRDLTGVKSSISKEAHLEYDQLSVTKEITTEKITAPVNEKKLKKSRDLTETKQIINKKDMLPSKKTPPNLFSDSDDDVDLFASVKKNKMKGSLFGGNFEDDNIDIFASLKSKPFSSEPSTGAVKKGNTSHAKKGSVFDDLDDDASDLFSPKVKSASVKTNADPKIVKDINSKGKSLFSDKSKINENTENDLFFTPSKSKSDKPSSLFGEDDDDEFDIFNPRKRPLGKQTKSTDVSVAKPSTAVKQHSVTLSSAEVTVRDPLSSFMDD